MNVETYRSGEPRADFALRIEVSRGHSRMTRSQQKHGKGDFDVWLPVLAPSARLAACYRGRKMTFSQFAAAYRTEMRAFEPRQLIVLLALLSQNISVSLGCHCEEESRCHRRILKRLIESTAKRVGSMTPVARHESASPVCYMEEFWKTGNH